MEKVFGMLIFKDFIKKTKFSIPTSKSKVFYLILDIVSL